jgi:hypothetical protein
MMICAPYRADKSRHRGNAAPAGIRLPIYAALLSALATLTAVLVPEIEFAYRWPALHVAIKTAAALVALLVSFLAYGRFLRSRALADLVLAGALLSGPRSTPRKSG